MEQSKKKGWFWIIVLVLLPLVPFYFIIKSKKLDTKRR